MLHEFTTTKHSPTFLSLSTPTFKMPSTKNTTAQTPGYPLSCSVMAKPTKDNQTPGYPLSCSVMKKPAANGQTPGYPLSCTVM
ncbi:Aquaporin-2 [Fusarium oxysporum f. sp. albedinis]|nr:Aquaporin-2 [Fusarium oxysporum f. sp. albedinis]